MRQGESAAVAAMVKELARHIGSGAVPSLTGDKLEAAQGLVDVVVADEGGRLVGACLGLMTYSTWRAAPGLYIVDLFVLPEARGRRVGLELLRCSARRFAGRGAAFVKLEVDEANSAAAQFYARLGFAKNTEDRLHILEQDKLSQLISLGGKT